jgi:predicted transcriptional regulator YdeE
LRDELAIGGFMELITRPRWFALGLEVTAYFDALKVEVPAAWARLYARVAELPRTVANTFVEVSTHLGEGRYREVVGIAAPADVVVPTGMTIVEVPSGDFLRHTHVGPVAEIAQGFGAMYGWADANNVVLGQWKVDSGYRPDGSGEHELLIDVVS